MASSFKTCEICGKSFNYTCGAFTQHLRNDHQISLKDYIVKFEYSDIVPKCQCGYCNEEPIFSRGKFLNYALGHTSYKWRHSEYIKKYGIPKCKFCEKEIGFNRLEPKKYCSLSCAAKDKGWNQEKCRKTLREHYGVDNPSQLKTSKESISKKNHENAEKALKKRKNTCREKYGVESVMQVESSKEKLKKIIKQKYGVDHIFKLEKHKKASSRRMKENNPMLTENNIRTHFYKNTKLTYQSSYEYDFLNLCERQNLLSKIKNGNIFLFENSKIKTDFSLDDYEIEIKSSWIMKKQGGPSVLFAKRDAVEKTGKKYILILDKDYTEFLKIIK